MQGHMLTERARLATIPFAGWNGLFFKRLTDCMSARRRLLQVGLIAAVGLAPILTSAEVTVVGQPTLTLLNVWTGTDIQEPAGAARAVSGSAWPDLFHASAIVGVYPSRRLDVPPTQARGFFVNAPVRDPATGSARVNSMALTGTSSRGTPVTLSWLEPYDVNNAGVIVGQAQVSGLSQRPYAFKKIGSGSVSPLAPGLDDGTVWAGSEATAVNNNNVVVGWKRPVSGTDRAFYWTESGGLQDIVIPDARSSRAISVNDAGLVVGYYASPTNSTGQLGFVYDIRTGTLTDTELGPVVVPTTDSWFKDFRNLSINGDGVIAATGPAVSGAGVVAQAFLLNGTERTAISAIGNYEETFATAISDTGWVVGFMRDTLQLPGEQRLADTGFLWAGGTVFDLTALLLAGSGWTRIDAVYDVYSVQDPDPAFPRNQLGIVVGEGTFNGASRAFAMQVTLQVPEPHVYVMFAVGLLAIGALRIRSLAPH